MTAPSEESPAWRELPLFRGLAGRLLALTFAVVLMAEALVFTPGLANFHESWLRDRINLAQTAALALAAAPDQAVPAALQRELLANAQVRSVTLRRNGNGDGELLLAEDFAEETGPTPVEYDYTHSNDFQGFAWAMETFFAPRGRVLRVIAQPTFDTVDVVEIVLNEAPLKRAMGRFAAQTILVSTFISLLAGAIVYAVLSVVFVRPIRRLTASIERFRDRPEDASIPFSRTTRSDEIGRAQQAAAEMADEVRASLKQRERLAQLGGAVARIAHDLRNMLSTAQIVSERLAQSEDPTVRQIAPRLERAIGRAAGLASSTARFGRVADEEAPVLKPVKLCDAANDAASDALAAFAHVPCDVDCDETLTAIADPDHVHRILVNLLRNAAQALSGREGARIALHCWRDARGCVIDIKDNGPGVPENVQPRLFEPFATTDSHGAGLGLAIARELARTLGGEVELARSGPEGACFRVTLPGA